MFGLTRRSSRKWRRVYRPKRTQNRKVVPRRGEVLHKFSSAISTKLASEEGKCCPNFSFDPNDVGFGRRFRSIGKLSPGPPILFPGPSKLSFGVRNYLRVPRSYLRVPLNSLWVPLSSLWVPRDPFQSFGEPLWVVLRLWSAI